MIINEGLSVMLKDVTQTVQYNTLIKEEKQKSDKLLGSILPASLVLRVQLGEKKLLCSSISNNCFHGYRFIRSLVQLFTC